jgi:uncharacterized protein YbaP (TraB family)
MFSDSPRRYPIWGAVICALVVTLAEARAACVWKVTGSDGHTLYLGGSMHGLHSTDYPLPAAYNRAFELSSRIVFEDDLKPLTPGQLKKLLKSGEYPKDDSLKNHVDPRVYDYLRRLFAAAGNTPEAQWSRLRPWALLMGLAAGGSNSLGVEFYLAQRARANHKPIEGLESSREHLEIIAGMTDQQAELALLASLVSAAPGTDKSKMVRDQWRAGNAEAMARDLRESYHDLPSFYQRLVVDRNHNWIAKIERYLNSRETYFVVAGAGHMGGPEGVLALLKERGYGIEQM